MSFVKVNKLFEKLFHFKVVRVHKNPVSQESVSHLPKGQNPISVDFIGASGIGKTTLLNKLMSFRDESFRFLNFSEFQKYFAEKPINKVELPNAFLELLALKYEAVHSGDYSIENKIKLHHFFHNTLKKVWFGLSANGGSTIVYDESLFHNFADVLPVLERKSPEYFQEMLTHRIFVNITSNPETILNQISGRINDENDIRSHHKNKTMNEIAEIQNEYLGHQSRVFDLLKKYNAPVLEIDAGSDLYSNAKEVQRFIVDHQLRD